MKNFLGHFLSFLASFFLLFIVVYVARELLPKKEKPTLAEDSSQRAVAIELVPTHYASRENVSVWLDPTRSDIKEALDSLDSNRREIGTVRPVFYEVKEGRIVLHGKLKAGVRNEVVYQAQKSEPRINVIPTFGNVDVSGPHGEEVLKLLQDPGLRKAALDKILEVAEDPDYAGVDMDWEGLSVAGFKLLADFIEDLSPNVHRLGKVVSVALEYRYVEASRHDWRRIGNAADQVEVIAYPEHHEGTEPGPIASVDWAGSQVNFALKAIPSSKIVLCMPLFGYIWEQDQYSGRSDTLDITWRQLKKMGEENSLDEIQRYGIDVKSVEARRDDNSDAHTLITGSYKASSYDGGQTRKINYQVWYEDAVSIGVKIQMAQKYGITQFGFWRIGGEDPQIWKLFQ